MEEALDRPSLVLLPDKPAIIQLRNMTIRDDTVLRLILSLPDIFAPQK